MKMISKKIVSIGIIIIILIELFSTVAYAGLCDSARGESGYEPNPPTPSDSPSTSIPSEPDTPTGDGVPTKTISHYETISGNVYEDLGYSVSLNGGEDNVINTIPIEGIIVRLSDGRTTRTDANGNWSFSNLADGTYSVEYYYGFLEGDYADKYSDDEIKNILKYNGQDYIAVSTEGQEYINSEKIEIEQSGKGALQLYIALDCSYSMRYSKVTVNGEEKTRLEVAVDSAKQLCESLINSGDNIYIGLIFFSGTNYRAVSLTKDTDMLNQALDDINTNCWYTANTNIVGALDKAYDSYYNNGEDSNRHLVILSDGVPTSDGNTETYCEDSDETIYSKLETISQSTKNKIQELMDNGVNVISLITKSDDEEENEFVKNIFSISSRFENVEDGNTTTQMIKEELKNDIISKTEEKYYTDSYNVLAGYEDLKRRQEVNDNFETLNYDTTIMFDQIENYNSEDEFSKEAAKELSSKTWMRVAGGQGYTINNLPDGQENPELIYETDPDTGEKKLVLKIYHVSAEYSEDLVLAKRPGFSLDTKITATGIRVILQNGQPLEVQTVEPSSNVPIVQTIDNELIYGTTIQIEYTINIKNDSSIQCNYLEMINHLPEGFVYDPDIYLITEAGQNEKYGWEIVSLEELKEQNLISENTLNTYNNKNVSLKLTRDNNGQGADGFYIAPGGECKLKYVVSRVIANFDVLDNPDLGIASEVLEYKNQANRRMVYTVGAQATNWLSAYPGNSDEKDFSNILTNDVIIIPPTGADSRIDVIKATTILVSIFLASLIGKIII